MGKPQKAGNSRKPTFPLAQAFEYYIEGQNGQDFCFQFTKRQQEILDLSLSVFAENGYDGASIAEIAEVCGMSQAGLLHHFKTKAELYRAVLAWRDRIDLERMPYAGRRRSGLEMLHGLRAIIAANHADVESMRLFLRAAAEATDHDHPAHSWAWQRFFWVGQYFSRTLDDDIDANRIRPDVDTVVLARQLMAMMDGLHTQWLIEGDVVDVLGIFDDYISHVIERISAENS